MAAPTRRIWEMITDDKGVWGITHAIPSSDHQEDPNFPDQRHIQEAGTTILIDSVDKYRSSICKIHNRALHRGVLPE